MMRLLAACLALCLAAPAGADYSQHDKVPDLLKILRKDFGYSEADLARVVETLKQAEPIPKLVQQEQKAPERTENWDQYSARVDAARIQEGVRVIHENARTFGRAEEEFGVPAPVIAGIMGIETRYGRNTGNVRVLDALATQGFDHPTRTAFFMNELAQFFVFCRDYGFDPLKPRGSYAGAMGDAQFMPSNYRRLALDYDGNGHRDLWTIPDAIGSIANYFVNFRPKQSWKRGEPLAVRAHLTGSLDADVERNGHRTVYTVEELGKLGVVADIVLPADMDAGLIELPLADGRKEYWIAFHNFYTVMTYNPRTFYAMAVTRLSQRIVQQMEAEQ